MFFLKVPFLKFCRAFCVFAFIFETWLFWRGLQANDWFDIYWAYGFMALWAYNYTDANKALAIARALQ